MATTAPGRRPSGAEKESKRAWYHGAIRARRVAENPRLFASPGVVRSSANAAPDRQSAIGIVHIDAMSFIATSPPEPNRPEVSLRVDRAASREGRTDNR